MQPSPFLHPDSNSNAQKFGRKLNLFEIWREWRTRRPVRRLQFGLVFGLLMGLFVAGAVFFNVLTLYESRFADIFYRPRPPSGKVVIVAVDDKTLAEFDWPLERLTHGTFLFGLEHGLPKVYGLAFVLPDPRDQQEDAFFARIIQREDNVVQPVLGIEATRFPSTPNEFPLFESVLRPAPLLRTPNTTLAHTMIYPDADGVVRRIPLAIDAPRERYLAFGLAALALYQGREPKVEVRNNQIYFGDQPMPLDAHGQLLLNFVNPDAIPKVAYIDVVQGKVDYAIFRDKIALVGPMTANAVPENYAVPSSVSNSRLFNIEIQADLIETLLSGNFLREQDAFTQIATILLFGGAAGATLVQLRWLYAAALMAIYFAGYLLYAFYQFDSGIIVKPLDIALVLLLTYGLTMLYRYFSEERTRAYISRIFLGTVAPESVREVIALYERGALPLSGGRRDVTVLCASLRGLSALSESLAPETAFELLDRYTARILEAVFRHGGSIHSYVGNTIFAMWNLPLDQPDHARRAIDAAFDIQQQISKLNETASPQLPIPPTPLIKGGQRGDEGIEINLGVATGPALAGHLSASARPDYAVIGDVVSLAERFSILSSDNQILTDRATCDQISDLFETRQVNALRVRGKKDSLPVYEVTEKMDAREFVSAVMSN